MTGKTQMTVLREAMERIAERARDEVADAIREFYPNASRDAIKLAIRQYWRQVARDIDDSARRD